MQTYLKNIIRYIILNRYIFIACAVLNIIIANTVLAKDFNQDSLTVKLNQSSVKDSSKVLKVKTKSPRKAMFYSLVFPGLGQLYNGKKLKALVFCGAEFGLLANSIYLDQMYKKDWSKILSDKKNVADTKNFYIENRNLSRWYLVGVLLFSILDAYVDAHLYNFDESPDLSIDFKQYNEIQRIMLSVSISF